MRGVASTIGRWLVVGHGSRRNGEDGSHRSIPVQVVRQPERGGDEARAARQPRPREPLDPRRLGRGTVGGQAPPPRRRPHDAAHPHRVDALERLDGADEHGGR